MSGLPAEKFCFEGFAPRKGAARRAWLAELAEERRTCVFFESPRRLAACLNDAVEQLGGARPAAICRERRERRQRRRSRQWGRCRQCGHGR
ncbi:Tetrapyrrole (Corrin-Porphyrin) methylase family protein UPF0011 [Mycobacterium tuberculosis]|nr:Tetrapyrrole (Corrin-Porphyrin) methylase family protein UPF0011 [Mycobacterium tuberculosis]